MGHCCAMRQNSKKLSRRRDNRRENDKKNNNTITRSSQIELNDTLVRHCNNGASHMFIGCTSNSHQHSIKKMVQIHRRAWRNGGDDRCTVCRRANYANDIEYISPGRKQCKKRHTGNAKV